MDFIVLFQSVSLPKPNYMQRKLFLILFSILLGGPFLFAQSGPGSLKGTITDSQTGETIPYVAIVIKDEAGAMITSGITDLNGKFHINPIIPGIYNVEVSCIGKHKIDLKKVRISPNKVTLKDFKMVNDTEILAAATVIWVEDIITGTINSDITTGIEVVELPSRSIIDVAVQKSGVTKDAAGNVFIKGTRPEGTAIYIDGVKIRGSSSIPQGSVGEIQVITGGIPASFGDVTGGIISTTTKGPSGIRFGNIELVSSSLFDQYDYNLAAFTFGGPLLKNKKGQPLVSYLLSSEFEYQREPTPTWVPYAKLNEEKLRDLENNPLQVNPSGQSVFYRSEFITEDDLTDINSRSNSYANELRLIGNLQIKTSKTTNLTLGGRWIYNNDKQANRFNHIFNTGTNMDRVLSNWNARARFQQYFRSEKDSKSLIQNAYYTIQADYTRNSGEVKDERYGTDFFKYGHIGSFDVLTQPVFTYGTDSTTGVQGYRFIGDSPNGVAFTQGPNNGVRGNYTRHYYELAGSSPGLTPQTIEQLIGNNIPVNGTNPRAVYDLWGSSGASQGRYSKFQNGQFRVTAAANFDIKDHSLVMGIEYEQRNDRAYNLDASGLWTQMRLLQNRPNQDLDLANPTFIVDENGVFQDTIQYDYLYSPNDASRFAQNIRKANGLDAFNTDQINIMNMDPSLFSLDFFSADELINPGGVTYANYYGFDYTGQLMNDQVSVSDFFTARDDNGDLTRPIGAFKPIYMAGYIQDKFTFNDLVFNVGVRIDRFDLNQEVLKDPYVLFPTHTVKDLARTEISAGQQSLVPSSIGQDYVVYVSSFDYSSASIVGYRNPETHQWFDVNGDPTTDPQALSDAAGGGIKPFLVTPPSESDNTLTSESFKDYKPQVVVMPRISFNFPITHQAVFMAHYDVLAQRPLASTSRSNPFSYLNLLNKSATGILNNPDLKPQVTTEYELGFKQALTEKSTLKISAFYRELRDLVQTTVFTQAYPITYVAYTNVDFSTTKGVSLEYELRRTRNLRLKANYTMQFADGTGSSANSGLSLANSGQPNLRYILPLNNDSRHQISILGDYRYGDGVAYTGPVWWGSRVFENAGVNLTMNALSGTPYTKRVDFRNNAQIDGQINGARHPWQVTFNTRISKVFNLKESKRNVEVYVQVLNLFNTRNILDVYDFTGSADDDGFLASASAQAQIAQQANAQSYSDLYNRAINNPNNYGLPRQIRLGVSYNF